MAKKSAEEYTPTPADPRNAQKWDAAEEGAELLREGQHDDAQRVLEAVVTQDDDNEYAYFYLGSVHFEKGRFDKALAAYVRAVEIAPNYIGALASVGHSLRMLGKLDQALRVAKQILLRDRDDADGLHLAGLTHFARGERAAAQGYLERFLRTHPELEVENEVRGILQVIAGSIDCTLDDKPN